MKQPPKLLPGQVWAKVTTNKRGVRCVQSRVILYTFGDRIVYTRRRTQCRCLLRDWLRWSKDAKYARTVQVPCINCNGTGSFQEGGTFSPVLKCDTCKGTGHLGSGSDLLVKIKRQEDERRNLFWVNGTSK